MGQETRQLAILLGILAAAKVSTFLPLFLFSDISRAGFMQELGTKWDSDFYVKMAQLGYNGASNPGTENAYTFSPVLPSMIAAEKLLTGSYWTAGLLIVNLFSFLFPVVIFKLSDLKTALVVVPVSGISCIFNSDLCRRHYPFLLGALVIFSSTPEELSLLLTITGIGSTHFVRCNIDSADFCCKDPDS